MFPLVGGADKLEKVKIFMKREKYKGIDNQSPISPYNLTHLSIKEVTYNFKIILMLITWFNPIFNLVSYVKKKEIISVPIHASVIKLVTIITLFTNY